MLNNMQEHKKKMNEYFPLIYLEISLNILWTYSNNKLVE